MGSSESLVTNQQNLHAQQRITGAPKHGSLNGFQLVHVAFGKPVTVFILYGVEKRFQGLDGAVYRKSLNVFANIK